MLKYLKILQILMVSAVLLLPQGCCKEKSDNPPLPAITTDRELVHAMLEIETDPYDLDLWKQVCVYLTEKRRFGELTETLYPYYLRFMRESSNEESDAAFMLLSVHLAQAYLFNGDYDEARKCLSAVDAFVDSNPQSISPDIAITYHNVSAILAVKENMDYSKALDHLLQALELAEDENGYNYCSLLCNIASIYCERGDTSGRKYAVKAYSIAGSLKDKSSMCYSSMLMAETSVLSGDYDTALVYADKAAEIADDYGDKYRNLLDMLYGDIHAGLEEYSKAEVFYSNITGRENEAENCVESEMLIETYMKRGDICLRTEKFDSALTFFYHAMELSRSTNDVSSIGQLYLGLSDSYYGLKDSDSSLKYFKKYYRYSDSIAFAEKERDFHRLLLDYERSRYNEELMSRNLVVQKQKQHIIIMLSSFICLILVLVWGLSLYRKKNTMYRKLSDQNHAYTERINKLMQALEESEHKSASKDLALYGRIRNLMEREKVWRDKDISLENMAELLGSNRSYVSRVINKYTGVSFANYINMKRVEEAKRLIAESDTPLKSIAIDLGYTSISSFSKAFYKVTGVPPSKYREIKKLQDNNYQTHQNEKID